MPKSNRTKRWRISRIGGPRQQYVTTVLALSEDAAIKAVIKEHEIKDAWEQRRLVAWPEETR